MFRLKTTTLTECPGGGAAAAGSSSRKIDARLALLRSSCHGKRLLHVHYSARRHAVVLLFSDGLIAWLFLVTGGADIEYVSLDKYLVGCLASTHVVDIAWREDRALFVSYTEPRVTGAFASNKPTAAATTTKDGAFKLKHCGTRLQEAELDVNKKTRRVPRYLSMPDEPAATAPHFAIWWQMTQHNVSPWSAPIRNDRDLANLLLYSYADSRLTLVAYASVTTEIIKVCRHHADRQIIVCASLNDTASKLQCSLGVGS